MKNIKDILTIMCMAGCVVSCDTLDYDESVTYEAKEIFTSFDKTQQFVTNIYSIQEDGIYFGNAMLAAATDEAVYPSGYFSNIHSFYNGAWSATSPLFSWSDNYYGIRMVNLFLQNSAGQTYSQFSSNKDYDEQMERFNNYKWEVRYLRAYFYFTMVRLFGDVPFVGDKVLTDEEANTLSRTSSAEIFDYIISECEIVAEHLPITYSGSTYSEVGRVTKGAALALRARAALYAASPLFNTDNDKALWLRAALANYDVLKYADGNGIKLGAYSSIWGSSSFTNTEMLMVRSLGYSNSLEYANFPMGVENGAGGNAPTQNLVDAYQMKATGKFWDEEGSGYDATKPYEGRDPRMALTIAIQGETKWPTYNTTGLDMCYNGSNGMPLTGASETGYYLKKLLDASIELRSGYTVNTKLHTWCVFRLGEFYLNYAEAVYRYFGSSDALNSDLPLSAVSAINKVRTRSGVDMPELTEGMDDDTFWRYYEAERMVELAFEDHRYFDVRRWKLGDKRFTEIKTMQITKNNDGSFTYTRGSFTRPWYNKYNFAPISSTEILKNPNLKQNPEW